MIVLRLRTFCFLVFVLLATFYKNRENYEAVEYISQPIGCLFWGSCHCPNIPILQYDLSFYANCVRLSLTTFPFDRVFDSVIISILSIIHSFQWSDFTVLVFFVGLSGQ